MRSALVASLVLIGLIALGMRTGLAPRRVVRIVDGSNSALKQNPKFTVHGWGETDVEAGRDALQEAQTKLVGYLRSLNPQVEWVPSLEYIDKHLAKLKKPDPVDPKHDLGDLKRVRIDMEL